MYKPKKIESKLLIYQKYTDVIDYGYNLLVKYPKTEKNYILACINSWLGYAKHCNSYNLVNKMFDEFALKK